MMRALYSSVSGLKTHQTKMDVIGNNIANVNTVGFKSSRTTFSTMMYQNTSFASGANPQTGRGGVNAKQIGLGTTFASTAIDIDTGGASESTGKAFDLKLSDKNSTSFYIVNTGTENVFTRAGAFYVDGAGNLCMESTGYTVMGWQVDANGNIRKDTVTPLKVMSADNQTSNPEYTTRGVCTGILDDKSSNVNSDEGYAMNLNFYDNLGYSYTARFAAQKTGDKGEYTVNLTDILDSNGKSIVSSSGTKLSDLFGTSSGQGSNVHITDNFIMASGMSGVLKRIATTPVIPAGGTAAQGTLTYTFPASVVNQYLSYTSPANAAQNPNTEYKMPDGYTVKYTVTNPEDPANATYQMELLDSSGQPVQPANYPFNAGWLSQHGNANDITKVVTVNEKLQEWIDGVKLDEVEIPAAGGATMTPPLTTGATERYKIGAEYLELLAQEFPTALPNNPSTSGVNIYVDVSGSTANPTYTLVMDPNTQPPWSNLTTATSQSFYLSDFLGQGYLTVDVEEINKRGIFTEQLPVDAEFRYFEGDGHFEIVTPSTDGFRMKFSTADGSLTYIGQQGSTSQTLRMSNFKMAGDNPNPFSDIQIDFSTLKNLSNGGASTAAMDKGDSAGYNTGKEVGALIGLSVEQSGKIYGSYSNGNTALLGQIAVARFGNASGLESIGENCYRTTMNSGDFDGIGVEMDSDGSTIDSGTLEMSNVDLATEFTQMITTQRGYQANSRVISTSDGILEELVNLKR